MSGTRNAALPLELLQQLRNHSLVSARVYTKSCDILVTDNVLNGDLQMCLTFCHLICTTTLFSRSDCPHFTDEETRAQQG